jgi:hypothetical protein
MSSDYTSKLRSASRKSTIHTRTIPRPSDDTSKRHSDDDVPPAPSTPSRHSSDESTRMVSIDSVFPSTPPSRVRREIYGDRLVFSHIYMYIYDEYLEGDSDHLVGLL